MSTRIRPSRWQAVRRSVGSQDQAGQGALTNCSNNGASHCVTVVIATNECAAAASNNYGEEVGASGPTVAAASSSALAKLQNQTGAKVIVSGCSNGNSHATAAEQSATAATGAEAGSDGVVRHGCGWPGRSHHGSQWGDVAVHVHGGQLQPWHSPCPRTPSTTYGSSRRFRSSRTGTSLSRVTTEPARRQRHTSEPDSSDSPKPLGP